MLFVCCLFVVTESGDLGPIRTDYKVSVAVSLAANRLPSNTELSTVIHTVNKVFWKVVLGAGVEPAITSVLF